MTTNSLHAVGMWTRIWARMCAPWKKKENSNRKLETPGQTFEHFQANCPIFVAGCLFDAEICRSVATLLQEQGLSYGLSTTPDILQAPQGKDVVLIVDDDSAKTLRLTELRTVQSTWCFLLLTFDARFTLKNELAKLGVDDFLAHPVTQHTLTQALSFLLAPSGRKAVSPPAAKKGQVAWLDEAEATADQLKNSGLSRRKFARKLIVSPAKVDTLVRIAALDEPVKEFIRQKAQWFEHAFSWVLHATLKLPKEHLLPFLADVVERQKKGETVTLASIKQLVQQRNGVEG